MKSPHCLIAALLLGFCNFAQAQFLSRHPYVQMTTPDSAAVLWRTTGGTIPIVRYGPAPGVYEHEVLPVQIVTKLGPDLQGVPGLKRLHSAPPGTYQYEAGIFGLDPGTTYYYGVFDNDQLLAGGDAEHRLTTLPQPGTTTPLRLWVTGDTGEGSESQIAGFEGMKNFVAADGRPIDAYLHLGDMAYEEGTDTEFSRNFFDIYSELLRNTTCWPTMGNHEGATSSGVTQEGPYYDSYVVPTLGEAGGEASGTEAYYSFDIGSVHFICLDSYDLDRSPKGAMAQWLHDDLAMANADWLIAFWHHPPYTKGTHNSDIESELIEMREFIMPILESGGVDLVLTGHSHIYERSMLIDGAYSTPTTKEGVILDDGDGNPEGNGAYLKSGALNPNEGTVAIVAGNGEGAARASGVMPVMRSIVSEVGSVIIDIDDDTLTAKMINTDTEVRDEFQIIKRGKVTQQIVENPWQPIAPQFVAERFEPGVTQVAVFPVPDVEDAVIHFTKDGTLPTSESAIYTDPVMIPDNGVLHAFNIWDGGELIGITGGSTTVPGEFQIHRFPASATDDGIEDSAGNVTLDGETIVFGNDSTIGVRFEDVRLPRDMYIIEAIAQFYKATTPERTPTMGTVTAELVADSPPFTTQSMDFSQRNKTAGVPWIIRTWSGSRLRDLNTESPNLRDIVAEVIDQPGWQSGNAMSFFFTHTGEGRTAGAFDGSKAHAATLSVNYINPVGFSQELAAQQPQVLRRPNGSLRFSMRWPKESIVTDLGLSFRVEASPDLIEWFRPTPFSSGITGVGADGFGTLFAEFSPQVAGGRDALYFRMVVMQE